MKGSTTISSEAGSSSKSLCSLLRYIMQCKIGEMEGAFVAYHNTQRIFGFEYITLEEMEQRVFG